MERAAFELWQLETKQIEDLIAGVERAQRELLASIGVPSEPARIYAILAGEQPAPWPKRTAARDKKRALHAMHTLVLLGKARQHVGVGHENSRLAAHAALLAGLHANASISILAQPTLRGRAAAGKKRGQQVSADAAANDKAIARYFRRWRTSDELRLEHRSAASYIAAVLPLNRRTIERRLKLLRRQ